MYCSRCGYTNEPNSKFCMKCGTPLEYAGETYPSAGVEYPQQSMGSMPENGSYANQEPSPVNYPTQAETPPMYYPTDYPPQAEAPAPQPTYYQEALYTAVPENPAVYHEPARSFMEPGSAPKKSSKKLVVFLIILMLVAVGIVAVVLLLPSFDKAGNNVEKTESVNVYEKADKLFEEGKYFEAAREYEKLDVDDKNEKITECADKLLEEGNYSGAREAYEMAGITQDDDRIKYIDAMLDFNVEYYLNAKDLFAELGDFKDSKEKLDICYFNLAEIDAKAGQFDKALEYYKFLPEDYEYDGIKAAERINIIENTPLKKLKESWSIKSKKSHSYGTGNEYWYVLEDGFAATLSFRISMREDGTFDLNGNVTFPLLPFYDEVTDDTVIPTEFMSFSENGITEIPQNIKVGENAKLTYSGGDYIFSYSDNDGAGQKRTVDITFEQEEET